MLLLLIGLPLGAAERLFDFGEVSQGQTPPGFRSTVTGKGKPGQWQIVLDEVPPLLPPLSPDARSVTKRAVLAQLAKDPTDDHYPLLVYDGETYRDFTLSTRFKLVDGVMEQMAGLAFRIQDEKNYYYVRASALGNSFYFFKFVNGELIGPIGSKVSIEKGVWHELSVECKGSQVTCSLDGKAIIPQMKQDTFAKGKIGLWTKSDSVSYFTDIKIVYTPIEPAAQGLVREAIRKYPRVLGLKVYVPSADRKTTRLVGSRSEGEIGQPGSSTELSVISRNEAYFGKDKGTVSVILPLRDRNGDALAAVRVVMKSFPGQTEANAIVRAMPIVKDMQQHVHSLEDLVE